MKVCSRGVRAINCISFGVFREEPRFSAMSYITAYLEMLRFLKFYHPILIVIRGRCWMEKTEEMWKGGVLMVTFSYAAFHASP